MKYYLIIHICKRLYLITYRDVCVKTGSAQFAPVPRWKVFLKFALLDHFTAFNLL